MKQTPLIYGSEQDALAFASALRKTGLTIQPVSVHDSRDFPRASHYVLFEKHGLSVTRQWARRVPPAWLKRTITCGQSLGAMEMIQLDDIGVAYACNTYPNLSGLLHLIGYLDAAAIATREHKLADAHEVADIIVRSTVDAFRVFQKATRFDAHFYRDLSQEFTRRIQKTPLILLVEAIRANQDTTLRHSALVTALATGFGLTLGFRASDVERVFLGAFFHDIGKSAVPSNVIYKPEQLTPEETRLVRSHASIGAALLRRFPETALEVADVALHHHEKLDGTGYPDGLVGDEITDVVRIVTICDIFAALIEERAYKTPMPPEAAYDVLRRLGPALDQHLVGAFGKLALALA